MARSRFRSVRYDLEAAVQVALIVDRAGGSVGSDVLARALGYSGTNNGAFLNRLAAARLFGVVGGRGKAVELTERGRQVLSGGAAAAEARREAYLAVPLFAAVHGWLDGAPLPDSSALATLLRDQFGEPGDRAAGVAARMIDCARQAGVSPASGVFTKFTSVNNRGFNLSLPGVGSARGAQAVPSVGRTRGDDVDDDSSLWLDDESAVPDIRRSPGWRRVAVVAAVVLCIAVVAVPVALVATGKGKTPTAVGKGQAEHRVLTALSATTDSGSFDFSYTLSTTLPTTTTTTTTLPPDETCSPTSSSTGVPGSYNCVCSIYGRQATTTLAPGTGGTAIQAGCPLPTSRAAEDVTGGGIIDTNPMAMLATADINSGENVTVRVDSTTVYLDIGSLETGLAPPADMANASGTPLSQFAGTTESALGDQAGAVAMMGMASPTGYLDLFQSAVTGASQIGTGTVDGVPVTIYKVSVDPSQLENAPGVSSEESQAISNALNVLQADGYASSYVDLSIDGSGFIRESKSVSSFADGSTAVLDATFSDFGCAGTVLMPGQQGSGQPPTGCSSPDTGQPLTSTSTSTPTTVQPLVSPTSTTSTSTTSTTTSTTVATVPTTDTTVPVSTPITNATTTTVSGGSLSSSG